MVRVTVRLWFVVGSVTRFAIRRGALTSVWFAMVGVGSGILSQSPGYRRGTMKCFAALRINSDSESGWSSPSFSDGIV
jgi:hypothetical protein